MPISTIRPIRMHPVTAFDHVELISINLLHELDSHRLFDVGQVTSWLESPRTIKLNFDP